MQTEKQHIIVNNKPALFGWIVDKEYIRIIYHDDHCGHEDVKESEITRPSPYEERYYWGGQ